MENFFEGNDVCSVKFFENISKNPDFDNEKRIYTFKAMIRHIDLEEKLKGTFTIPQLEATLQLHIDAFIKECRAHKNAPDFCSRIMKIPGINKNKLIDWVENAFSQALISEEDGVPQSEAQEKALNEFAEAFEKIELYHNGTAAEIFNFKAGYAAHELYGAAEFIANGGNPAEALELASNGAFEGAVALLTDEEFIADFAKRNKLADTTVTLQEGNWSGYGKDGKEYVISVSKNGEKFISDWHIGDEGSLQATLIAFETDTRNKHEFRQYIEEYRRQEFMLDMVQGLCEKYNVDKNLIYYYAKGDSSDVSINIGSKHFGKNNTEEFVEMHFELGRGKEKQDYSKFNDDIDKIFKQFSADNMAKKYDILRDLAEKYGSEGFTVKGYLNLMQQFGTDMSVDYSVYAVKRYEDNTLATYNDARKCVLNFEREGIDFSPQTIKSVVIQAVESLLEKRKTNAHLHNNDLFWQPPEKTIMLYDHVVTQHDLIGKKLYLAGEDEGSQMYEILTVNADGSVHIRRDDSWTFDAVGFELNDDGTIEWGYTKKNAHFADENILNEYLKKQNQPSLKKLIDNELGENTHICVYNEYGDFLCEGEPKDLRKDGFWAFINEETLNVHSFGQGLSESGKEAVIIHLSNFLVKERAPATSQSEWHKQLKTELGEKYKFAEHLYEGQTQPVTFGELRVMLENGTLKGQITEPYGTESKEYGELDGKTLWSLQAGDMRIDLRISQYDMLQEGKFGNGIDFHIYSDVFTKVNKEHFDMELAGADYKYSDLDITKVNSITDLENQMFETLDKVVNEYGLRYFAPKTEAVNPPTQKELYEQAVADDRFYLNDNGRIERLYYNPDGYEGEGQYVSDIFYHQDILNAVEYADGSTEKFYEYLDMYAKQYLYDNDGGKDFWAVDKSFNGNSHNFIGCTEETMSSLIKFATLHENEKRLTKAYNLFNDMTSGNINKENFIQMVVDAINENKCLNNEEKPQTFLEFLRSDGEYGDYLFNGDVIVGDVEMNHALVWNFGDDITDYCYEQYADLLNSPYKIHDHGNGYEVIEVFCDDYKMGEDFFAAAAGYIADSEHKKMFIEIDYSKVFKKENSEHYIFEKLSDWTAEDIIHGMETGNLPGSISAGDSLFYMEKGEFFIDISLSCDFDDNFVALYEIGRIDELGKNMERDVDFIIFDLDVENIEHEMSQLIENHKKEQSALKNNLTEEKIMEKDTKITVRVTPIEGEGKLKGSATVTIGDQFAVHGVKIVQGEKGLFVSMPSEKGRNDKFYDTVLPKSKEASALITEKTLAAYQDACINGKQQKGDLSPTELSIKVSNLRKNPNEDSGIKASCQITINDMLVIKNVKVIANKETGELGVGLPSKQDGGGGYIPVAHAITSDFYTQIKTAVVNHFQNPPQTLGNTSYGKLADKSQGEEILHKTYNSQFAEKVGEQLDANDIRWSAKLEGNGKSVVSVNMNDAEKFYKAVETAKELAQGNKNKPEAPEMPEAPAKKTGGRK
jgi:stage V sporulation protein G